MDTLPFAPADDLIFVLKSVENVIFNPEEAPTVAFIRDILQANMCSRHYIADKARSAAVVDKDDQDAEPPVNEETGHFEGFTRGLRMLVFVTASMEMPKNLPELKPEIIPLPGPQALKIAALDILEPLWD